MLMQIRSAVNHRVKTMLLFSRQKIKTQKSDNFFYADSILFSRHVLASCVRLKETFLLEIKGGLKRETPKKDHKFKNCRDRRVSRLHASARTDIQTRARRSLRHSIPSAAGWARTHSWSAPARCPAGRQAESSAAASLLALLS